jgi:hypothetical protein
VKPAVRALLERIPNTGFVEELRMRAGEKFPADFYLAEEQLKAYFDFVRQVRRRSLSPSVYAAATFRSTWPSDYYWWRMPPWN